MKSPILEMMSKCGGIAFCSISVMDIPSACLLLLGLVVTVLAHEAPTLPGVPGVPPTAHQHGAQGGHPNQGQAQHKPGTPPHPHHSFKEGSRDRG